MKKLFQPIIAIFILTREVFPYALLFYLVLFLLENLLTGFVSNNFSLNWVLVTVLVLGFLAAFAPEREKEELEKPVGRNDYLLVAVLGLIGGAIIFAKLEMGVLLRWVTTVVSGGLIMLVGLVVLSGKDEEEYDGVPLNTQSSTPLRLHWRNALAPAKRMMRLLLLRRVELPLAYVLLFALVTAFLIPKNITMIANALRSPVPAPAADSAQQEPPPSEPFFWDDVNQFVPIPPSDTLQISVLNGGGESGAAASFSALLRDNGFGRVTVGNADRYDYTNAQIRFAAADKPQANIIKQLLLKDYPLIMELPAGASASGITVVLGAKEKTQ